MKNLDKIKFFDPKKIRKIAADHTSLFKKRVRAGRDKDGNQLPKYSAGYIKSLRRDMKRAKDGKRYKGLEGIGLETSGSKIAKRPLILRGLTMKNLEPRKHGSDFYEIGWDGEAASIVDWQAEKGRDIINDIPDDEMQRIVSWLGDAVEDEWKKIPNVTTIRVGK